MSKSWITLGKRLHARTDPVQERFQVKKTIENMSYFECDLCTMKFAVANACQDDNKEWYCPGCGVRSKVCKNEEPKGDQQQTFVETIKEMNEFLQKLGKDFKKEFPFSW